MRGAVLVLVLVLVPVCGDGFGCCLDGRKRERQEWCVRRQELAMFQIVESCVVSLLV